MPQCWDWLLKEDPRVLFGRRLRAIRTSMGLSQEKLALEADLDRTYISGVERGRRNIALINIVKVAEALHVAPSALLELEEE